MMREVLAQHSRIIPDAPWPFANGRSERIGNDAEMMYNMGFWWVALAYERIESLLLFFSRWFIDSFAVLEHVYPGKMVRIIKLSVRIRIVICVR